MLVSSVGYAPVNYGFALDDTDTTGKEEFLTLLVAQMQNQDPLEPLSNEEFVAQLAQFNSLEQMININDSLESELVLQTLSSASNLLGKEVEAVAASADSGEGYKEISGTVQEARLEEGAVVLSLNTEAGPVEVLLGDVLKVR